jgi:ethanolamine utilization protein EutN
MFLARVIGDVVSTVKHEALDGLKLLVIERVSPSGEPLGDSLLAVDSVQAGVGDSVLVVDEGGSASMVTGLEEPPIRTVIVGIVDNVYLED